MTENTRTQTIAAIKRASYNARQAGNRLDREALDELTRLYKIALTELREIIAGYASDDGSLKLDALNEVLAQANRRLNQLQSAREALLREKMTESAALGASVFAETGVVVTQVASDAVEQAYRFVAEDGLQLSDRLWRIDNHAKQVVADSLQLAIIQGNSAAQAALDLISGGGAIPRDLAAKMRGATPEAISKAMREQLMTGKGTPYDNALRLFRTEINRAHGNAYQAGAFTHPDVIGTRFLLSPNHPKRDICDLHARVNRYGLGPGVYPKNRNPWPAHPNTLSYVEAVFSDEVSADDKKGKTNRLSFLKTQSPIRQNAILGVGKGWALREGLLTENSINTPWNVLKKRYNKAGVDVSGATTSANALPSAATSILDVVEPTAYFSQVDNALNAINKVHSVRGLPSVEIFRSSNNKANGFYDPNQVRIGLTDVGTHPDFTALHEIGHFLDHKAFVGSGFSSVDSDMFEGWRNAVGRSPEVQNLVDIFYGKRDDEIAKLGFNYSKKHTAYLLEVEEMWARSYSQWVARKSGQQRVNEQLDARLDRQRTSPLKYTAQWDDDNFKPIADAIDTIFKQMGWLNNE